MKIEPKEDALEEEDEDVNDPDEESMSSSEYVPDDSDHKAVRRISIPTPTRRVPRSSSRRNAQNAGEEGPTERVMTLRNRKIRKVIDSSSS